MKYLILFSLFITGSGAASERVSPSIMINEAFQESAVANHIDVKLLRALCFTESGLKPNVRTLADGPDALPSVGLCQVKLMTARQYGFKGDIQELYNPHVNAFYAGKILAHWLKVCHNNWKLAVSSYNTGHRMHHMLIPKVIKVTLAMMENR